MSYYRAKLDKTKLLFDNNNLENKKTILNKKRWGSIEFSLVS